MEAIESVFKTCGPADGRRQSAGRTTPSPSRGRSRPPHLVHNDFSLLICPRPSQVAFQLPSIVDRLALALALARPPRGPATRSRVRRSKRIVRCAPERRAGRVRTSDSDEGRSGEGLAAGVEALWGQPESRGMGAARAVLYQERPI